MFFETINLDLQSILIPLELSVVLIRLDLTRFDQRIPIDKVKNNSWCLRIKTNI